ncbi:allophanate hydrolase [Curtobacterium sp. VKM Ac-2887]|uniref:allophanate hydrolase n=1 Tax=Curtobacterium sp. VKM Ac-2887 TaxID=2783819 RepID=UPI00188A2CE4|nr:allophanate hydrolase [Curtobacterium sp. VKM Ac-2887]MBF4586881.1 allophanate hydrolase [Curtobacterium sp. VKM Ac-2887]
MSGTNRTASARAGGAAGAATAAADRVRDAFDRIDAVDRPEVWITLRDRAAVLQEAEAVDPTLPLAGLLFAVKDNIDVAGLPTTAAARSYAYEPAADATAVARLRAAGAVVVGKTNLDQFATGLVGTRSPFGAVRNAWDPTRISGGSSSGSATAVALGIVDFALGTDTAGSGRVPAALGNLVGVKPTKGLVPNTGVVPACRSQDCVTVFARSLDLARTAAELMAGPDDTDPLARIDVALADVPAVPRIAIPLPSQLEGLAPGWAEAFAAAVERFRALGHQVVEVDIAPLLDAASLLYDGAFVAERYAAVGAHVEAHRDLVGDDLDPSVATIVLGGARPTAAELFADQERLDVLGAAGRAALAGTTALLTPTTTWHPTLDEVAADPIGANSRMGRYTNFANLLDMASLAVPAGFVDGLPFGVMLTGPAFTDRRLAALGAAFLAPTVDLLVVGAHLRDQPLNGQLVASGGSFVREARTASDYRLYALDTVPPKPGLVRVGPVASGADAPGSGSGSGIAGEVWRLPAAGFGTFVASLPAPMAIGTVALEDGTDVTGFLVEPFAVEDALDITAFGGWRTYREQE